MERFEQLFTDHVDAVLVYASAWVDPEAAKDAVADTFLVAWRRLHDVPDPARAWLLAVTRRTLAGQRRSRRRQHRLAERLVHVGPEPDVSGEPLEAVTDRSVVMAALGRLSADDRELLCLVAWDGLNHSEAAEVLACSPATFAVRLHRARGRLETALQAEDGVRRAHDPNLRVHGGEAAANRTQEVPRDGS